MSRSADYFFAERYKGLDLIPELPSQLGASIATAINQRRRGNEFPESIPEDFSQELLFFTDNDVSREFVAGEVRFPYYARVGGEKFWRSQRSQAPYIERMVELYPCLDLELVEQLWLERGRGMSRALPSPNDRKGRWRAIGELTPGLVPPDTPRGPYASAIVTPRCGIGGAEKTMREVAASLERLTGLPSLIVVADTHVSPDELPAGAICLPNMTVAGEPFLRNRVAARALALRDLLVEVGVSRVISMNSFVGNTLLQDGALQAMGIKTASVLFCVSLGPGGAIEGFLRTADWLIDAGVTLFTDNDNIARMLSKQNFYDDTVVLAMPETVTDDPAPAGSNVLWAGRIDTQKRPDLLVEIAARSPHITYEVWGVPLLSASEVMDHILAQPNIIYRGGFEAFAQIDMTNIACLLYTSDYDGTPNLLLEALARGLPCLCSAVGGIPDLMADGRGVLVDPGEPAEAYVAALDRLLADPAGRRRMAVEGRDHIRATHSIEVFDQSVARLLAKM